MKETKAPEGLLQRLLASLLGRADPETDKLRILKREAKKLSKIRYKFYKYAGDEASVQLALFFYDIYKTLSASQNMFYSIRNQNVLKQMCVNFVLTERQLEIIDNLDETAITARADQIDSHALEQEIRSQLDEITYTFNDVTAHNGDNLYTAVILFRNFCLYDYFFFLKKFAPSLKENDFTSVPQFKPVRGADIAEYLEEFIQAAWPILMVSVDWKLMLKAFKSVKGVEPLSASALAKLIGKLSQLRESEIFEIMLKLIKNDPFYVKDIDIQHEVIMDKFVEKLRARTEDTLKQVLKKKKAVTVEKYVPQLFGSSQIQTLHGYTEETCAPYESRKCGEFIYYQPLNYMKTFLTDYVRQEIRQFSDIVLVRGQWTVGSLAAPMSESYNSLLNLTERINEFDKSLAPDSPWATKMRVLLSRSDRDHEALYIMRTQIHDTNTTACNLLLDGTRNIITYGKTTKALLDDYTNHTSSLITNWNELERFAEQPINKMASEIYKKIHLFVNLMKNYIGK